jgi:hypothetical protein
MNYRTKTIIKYLFFTIIFIIYFVLFFNLIKEWIPLRNKLGFYLKINEISIKVIGGSSLLIIMLYIIIYNFIFDIFQIVLYYNKIDIYYENISYYDLSIKYLFYTKYYFYHIITYYWNVFFILIANIIIIYFMGNIIIWRCPKCKKFFGWSMGIKKCRHCEKNYY